MFLLTGDPLRHYLLAIMFLLGLLVMIIEASVKYYSGFDLDRSPKVYP